jgi:hypothetical protein
MATILATKQARHPRAGEDPYHATVSQQTK